MEKRTTKGECSYWGNDSAYEVEASKLHDEFN